MSATVVVIGLGAVGSWTAWKLAEAGATVVGLEARSLVHADGAYAGESRLFRAAYHEGAEYVPLLKHSREAWVALEESSNRSIFHPTGVLSIGAADAPQMANVQRSLEDSGLEFEVLSAQQLRERFPQHADITDEIGVLDLLGGVLRPESAVAEIQRRAVQAGAVLRGHAEVTSLTEGPAGVIVELEGERIAATTVVVCAGMWSSELLPELKAHLSVLPLALTWFCPEDPSTFAPEVFPGFIRDKGGVHLFGMPTLDGSLVKAGFDAQWGSIDAPADLERTLSSEQTQRVEEAVSTLLPGLGTSAPRASMHADVFTSDKRAILGELRPGVLVGTGFSGHGFKLTPAFGDALAQLALNAPTTFDLAAFSPSRFCA